MDSEIFLAPMLIPILVMAAVIAVIIAFAVRAKKSVNSKSNSNGASGSTVYRTPPKPQQSRQSEAARHQAHVADARAHSHKGEEEHYEEIVGSLGDVNDEGCADLDGVRFISHDVAYDPADGSRDYSDAARLIVLGEILNTPRFKSPYGKSRRG